MQSSGNPTYKGEKLLSEIDSNLVKYSNHIVDLFLESFELQPSNQAQIVDFGAGQGTLAEIWASKTSYKPFCVELDPQLIKLLRDKGFRVFANLTEIPLGSDLIYTSNVLEHIEDDLAILRDLKRNLKPGGYLVIYVPAFEILFSKLDVKVGHYRRYSKRDLLEKLEGAGFDVEFIQYSDSLGFFVTIALKLLRFSFSPNSLTSKLMRFYDRFFVPLSIFADSLYFKHIVGKNIFAVARTRVVE